MKTGTAKELSIRARDTDPDHKLGIGIYLESLFRLHQLEELDEFLLQNAWIREELACPSILARIDFDRGNLEEATNQLRRALESSENQSDPLMHALLGQIIAHPIRNTLSQNPPLPWKMSENIVSQLLEAESQLNAAAELLESHQDKKRFHEVLVNRAGVHGMLGKLDAGLEDCRKVFSENPKDDVAIRNLGIILFHLGQHLESNAAFEKLRGTDHWSIIALMVASNFYDVEKPQKSVDTIESIWEPGRRDHHELLIAHFLIKAYHKLNNVESISRVEEVIRRTWPNDPEALLTLGDLKFQQGKIDEAFALMREGLNYAEGNQKRQDCASVGDISLFSKEIC